MGSLLAILGDASPTERQRRLQAMADRSPYRGSLRFVHLDRVSAAVQARTDDSGLFEDDRFLFALHGRVYPDTPGELGSDEISSAETIGKAWSIAGSRCLTQLDGEFSLLVHEKSSAITFACVSLSMTRPLYWASHNGLTIIGSEIRQVAEGAGIEQRLDLERFVEQLSFSGPVLNNERTQYVNIDRFMAPNLYEHRPGDTRFRMRETYWTPPETSPGLKINDPDLPFELLRRLSTAIDPLFPNAGLSLSGGYDSGTLWAIAHRRGAPHPPPKGYALTFPGNANDESDLIGALLRQTGSTAQLIDANNLKPSQFAEEHVACIDQLPAAATLFTLDVLCEHLRAGGLSKHITGIGAEAWLYASSAYAADLLRQGHLLQLTLDSFRFRYYAPRRLGQLERMRRFFRDALAPPGSWVSRRRPSYPPEWLGPRWHGLYQEGRRALERLAAQEGFGRGEKWVGLKVYSPGGMGPVEQTCERYGIELACPFLHRKIADLAFEIPARTLCGGRHPKHLLRLCAALALETPPPWPLQKVLHTAAVDNDPDQIRLLGPVENWRLADAEILTLLQAKSMTKAVATSGACTPAWSRLALAERYLRVYSL